MPLVVAAVAAVDDDACKILKDPAEFTLCTTKLKNGTDDLWLNGTVIKTCFKKR